MKAQDQMTSAESRTLREWLGLSTAETADLSGINDQTLRRSEAGKRREQGRVAPHPTAVTTLRQVEQIATRAAPLVEPVLIRNQGEYDQVAPQPALGDWRIHNAAVLRHVADPRLASAIRWAIPGRLHDDATVHAMRRRTGISLDWLANQLELHINKLRRIENGDEPIPDEVRTFLAALVDDTTTYRDLLLNDATDCEGPAVFVRFRSDADLEDADDDANLELPATTHALATWDAMEHLRGDGRTAAMIWLNPREYRAWLNGEPDTRVRRNEWATHEWAATQHR